MEANSIYNTFFHTIITSYHRPLFYPCTSNIFSKKESYDYFIDERMNIKQKSTIDKKKIKMRKIIYIHK